jgi:hypothetical protein
MTDAQLRARIRTLIGSGALPPQPPPAGAGRDSGVPLGAAPVPDGGADASVCLICAEVRPQTTYELGDGTLTHVHRFPCDALWREEAAKLQRGAPSQGAAASKDPFIRWLDDRRAQDTDFEKRMEAALRALRVERIAAAIHAARARASRPKPLVDEEDSIS